MSHTVPTVKVRTDSPDNEEGFYLINKDDFDPEVHELFEELTDKKPQPTAVPTEPKKGNGKK